MKKIPTLFKRDPDNRSRVLPELAVQLPEGAYATLKLDGMAVMCDGTSWWKRREVKPDKPIPAGFLEAAYDEVTGKRQGWVPIGDGPEDQWLSALVLGRAPRAATYEAIGPHFQGNPHGYEQDLLVEHGIVPVRVPTDFEGLHLALGFFNGEGVVWWADGEPVAKIKRRDFGYPWPIPTEATS